jgi:CBS-domain-containing membrane protein
MSVGNFCIRDVIVPVVDDQGGLVGIVTLDDLLKIVGQQLIPLAQVIGRERFQEQQSRR